MQNSHNATPSSSPPSTTTTTAITTGGIPACASCRHQRKKCTEKCILAPFFPAEKKEEFEAVHKVFGVSNVTKLVKGLSRENGEKAVDSLIWEAKCRLKDPVLGPLGEFQRVCEELKFYKSQYHHHHHQVANSNNNLRQVPVTQGAMLYNKSAQNRLIGTWNGDHHHHHNNGIVNNGSSMLNYIDNSRMFNYGSLQNMEKLKQERDEQKGSLIHPQHEQQMMNDFSQFY